MGWIVLFFAVLLILAIFGSKAAGRALGAIVGIVGLCAFLLWLTF